MKYLSLIVPVLVTAAVAKAAPPNETREQNQTKPAPFHLSYSLPRDSAEMTIQIEDKTEVPNACDYHIQRFEYVRAINTLLINVEQESCFADRYGKRRAELHWTLPQSIRQSGKLCVVVNQSKIGSVFYDRARADFVVGQTESCE